MLYLIPCYFMLICYTVLLDNIFLLYFILIQTNTIYKVSLLHVHIIYYSIVRCYSRWYYITLQILYKYFDDFT